MPNHCYNTIEVVDGKPADYRKVAQALKSEEQAVDFNCVVPMPKALKGENDEHGHFSFPNPKKEETDTCGVPKSLAAEFTKKYGAPNWYDWSLKNWGTKWNAYDIQEVVKSDGSPAIPQFMTAWSPPEAFYLALSQAFPKLTFKCHYDIELGNGSGYMVFKNGRKTIDHEEQE